MLAQTVSPSNEQRAGRPERVRKTKQKNIQLRSLFDLPKLCMVIEDVETIPESVSHF